MLNKGFLSRNKENKIKIIDHKKIMKWIFRKDNFLLKKMLFIPKNVLILISIMVLNLNQKLLLIIKLKGVLPKRSKNGKGRKS